MIPAPIGARFGRLTVIAEGPRCRSGKWRMRTLRCRCDCGQLHLARFYAVLSGGVHSCGCAHRGRRNQNSRSGMSSLPPDLRTRVGLLVIGTTFATVAKALGVSPDTLRKLRRGALVRPKILSRILTALETP